MYKRLLGDIEFFIENYIPSEMSERDQHYFKQGVNAVKQLIEQAEDFDSTELAYETLESTLLAVSDKLSSSEVEALVDEIFV